jgi:hypothetical protein
VGVWEAGSSSEDEGAGIGGGHAAMSDDELFDDPVLDDPVLAPEMLDVPVVKERNAALDAYDKAHARKSGTHGFRIGDMLLSKNHFNQSPIVAIGVIFHVAIGPDTPLAVQVLCGDDSKWTLTGTDLHNARNNFKQLTSEEIEHMYDVCRDDFIDAW